MKITEQEFMELYGEEKVSFSSYYKYRFHFSGTMENGNTIYLTVGGHAYYIYKFMVNSSDRYYANLIEACSGIVRDKDGKEIHRFEEE